MLLFRVIITHGKKRNYVQFSFGDRSALCTMHVKNQRARKKKTYREFGVFTIDAAVYFNNFFFFLEYSSFYETKSLDNKKKNKT